MPWAFGRIFRNASEGNNVKYWQMPERNELTDVLTLSGFSEVVWKFPEETGFYQPIVIAKR